MYLLPVGVMGVVAGNDCLSVDAMAGRDALQGAHSITPGDPDVMAIMPPYGDRN